MPSKVFLLDKNGDVIISEKTVITNEVIDRAEIEGKLHELIVNIIVLNL